MARSSAPRSPPRGRSAPPAGPAAAAAVRRCRGGCCCGSTLRRSPGLAPGSTGGTTVVSATNGKTTTAGMIAAILAADGRHPVHNRAGSNMTWGVATALLEQRGREGLFEVDEAWLPRVVEQLEPGAIVLGNLFRDQLDRYGEMEALADEWAKTVAARAGRTALRPQRRRPADRRPRPRRRRAPARGRRLLRDRGLLRRRCRELQHAFDAKHCRRCGHPYAYERAFVGHLGHYSCPNCGAERPRPDVAATAIELRGMEGSRSTVRTPAGELELELPLPGLYNVYNALGGDRRGPAASASRRRGSPPPWARCGPPSAGSRRSRSAGKPVSILLIKNPAGANEVLRTLRLEAGRGAGVDLWIALNDRIADGRDVSWVWDADFELLAGRVRRVVCAGTRAPEMALRLKYAGWRPTRSRWCRRSRPRSTHAVAAAAGPPLRPPHLHRPDGAAQAARRPRPGQGVLAVSATAERAIWHDAECGAYAADLALWEELAAAAGGPVLDLGCGTGRVALAPRPPRAHGRSASTSTRTWSRPRRRARRRACRCAALARRRPRLRARPPTSPWPWRRCSCCSCSATSRDGPPRVPRLRRRPPRSRAAAWRLAIVEGLPRERREGRRRSPTSARSTAGSTRACPSTRRRRRRGDRHPPPAPDRLPGRRAARGGPTRSASAPSPPTSSRRRRARPGLVPLERRRIPPTDLHVGSTVVVLGEGRPDGAARPQPLPGADEHLRRPRQHPLPAAALRVARDRLRPRGAPAPASRSIPAAHDLFYIGGGQDRDQRMVAADMVATKRADLAAAVESGAALLAVCGGYQLLGHSYQLGDETPARARPRRPRDGARARPAADRQRRDRGRPRPRPAPPRRLREPRRPHLPRPGGARRSAASSAATATTATTASRGCGAHNMFGTYLHGPLLPKNAWLADHLIALGAGAPLRLPPRARAARRRLRGRRARERPPPPLAQLGLTLRR